MGKKFTAQTIEQVRYMSYPAAHPDGHEAVYVCSMHRKSDGKYQSWLVRTDAVTGRREELTDRECENAFLPRYSGDGKHLAYLSDRTGEKQLWILDLEDGKRRRLTSLRRGADWYDMRRDREEFLIQAGCYQEEIENGTWDKEMSSEERKAWEARKDRAPVVIDKPFCKDNSAYGLLDGRVDRIVKVFADGKLELFGGISFKARYPVYSRDGQKAAFYGFPYKGVWEPDPEVFICAGDGSGLKQLTRTGRPVTEDPPCFNMDGSAVIYSSYYEGKEGGCEERLYQVSAEDGQVTALMGDVEETKSHGINGAPCSRTVYGTETPCYQLNEEGSEIWYRASCEGYERVFALSLDGTQKIREVTEFPMSVHSFCLPANGRMFFTAGDYTTIAELHVMDMETKKYTRLTDENLWLKEYDLSVPRLIWVPTADKKTRIQVWVMAPANMEAGKKYPAVLDVHGGPECSYTVDFWHEFQAIVAEGMAVVYCNPRGSLGYGVEFSRDEYSWGEGACQDLLGAIEAAAELGFIDSERVGITGGSYGGMMTNKMIAKTDRFTAAVTQRCLINTATSYGCGDMGFESRRLKEGESLQMMKVLERRARSCLMGQIDSISTPLLILHGYKDYRCTFEQAEQVFIGMKERNPQVPVRMVMFPEENHDITREGNLYNQICHLQEIINWFCKYLKEGGDADE